jgi:hypothetical protein
MESAAAMLASAQRVSDARHESIFSKWRHSSKAKCCRGPATARCFCGCNFAGAQNDECYASVTPAVTLAANKREGQCTHDMLASTRNIRLMDIRMPASPGMS